MKRALILVVLLFAVAAWPQEKKPETDLFTNTYSTNLNVLLAKGPQVEIIYADRLGAKDEKRGLIRIRDSEGILIVDVDIQGKVTYGEKYKPDDAARTFWEVLAKYYPVVCKSVKSGPAEAKP